MLDRTKLLDALEKGYIKEWREEIEKEIEDDEYYSLVNIKECLKSLGVDEKTISVFIAQIETKQDYIHLNIENQLANLCIEIGMELGVDEYLRENP